MKVRLAIGLVVMMLAGCAAPGAPKRVLNDAASPKTAVFATELAGPTTYLAPLPTAIIILKPDDMDRNRAFCAAVAKLPTAQEAAARSVVAPNLILTRWLTQLSDVPADRIRDCDYLVGTYDYSRAAALIASLHVERGTVAGKGPYLAMVIPGDTGLRVVAVDGSRYNAQDFDDFVASWKVAIDQTAAGLSVKPDRPGLVRSVFDLVAAVLRTAFGATAGLIEGTIGGL